ncbi:MAG: hypothetical protein IKF42_12285 [Mogibacterium sp.]|nr:hypothetical protein [Mogibacterium sp.]
MKKGLSILLVAAALFGFYGGAVNLNDVLACKDYWEKAGEESTANMNKLEDGLNQLKENEQAYLDGKQQVADGEVALADAEVQLADGEAKLADGRAELAKGEADYAAAPGKLADARVQIKKGEKDLAAGEKKLADGYDAYNAGKKTLEEGKKAVKDGEKKLAAAEDQLAQGEKDLAAGKKQVADGEVALKEGQAALDGLTQLIGGIETILNGYNGGEGTWKPGYDALKKGRNDLYAGSSGSKDSLVALAAFLPDTSKDAYVKAVNDVAGDDGKQTAADYKDFINSTNTLANALPVIQEGVGQAAALAQNMLSTLSGAKDTNAGFAKAVADNRASLKALAKLISDDSLRSQYIAGIDKIAGAYDAMPGQIAAGVEAQMKTPEVQAKIAGAAQQYMEAGMEADAAKAKAIETVQAAVTEEVKKAAAQQVEANEELTNGKTQLLGAVNLIYNGNDTTQGLKTVNELVNGENSAIKNQLLPGLKLFNESATDAAIDKLTAGQDQIAGGVSQIASAVLGNEQLKAGVENNLGKDAIKLLTAYQNVPGRLSSAVSDFEKFEAQMDTNPNLVTNLTKAKALLTVTKAQGEKDLASGKQALEAGKKQVAEGEAALAAGYAEYEKGKKDLADGKQQIKEGEPKLAAAAKQLAKGEKDLAAGKKKLADGKAQYAQGLKDYKAAPAKLADGRRQLAEGEAQLQDGYQAYEQGKKDLADGKAKLAEYEDGEQQVRDGLKTLTDTEADLDLQSIASRLNGDVDFDNGDNHLDLEEGLAAVEVGRGYQADDGVLISDEIMARAVGTGALLGAGVLAVLAAIMSFLKKNKGAGILAILAAAAGAFGAFYGTQSGTYFSSIAGSTVGATGWVAAGILGAVALVHAITHFTAKKEA